MPELNLTSVTRWQRYVPDLPGNREAKAPFYFELNASLTKEQLRAVRTKAEPLPEPIGAGQAPPPMDPEASRQARVKRYAEAFTPYVRLGAEPLKLDGADILTLEQYLDAMSRLAFEGWFLEPGIALQHANSLGDLVGFFSERLSGGFTSTTAKSSGQAESQRAGR